MGKTIDSHFVPIPTLRRDNSGIEPCQVGIPTSQEFSPCQGQFRNCPDSYFAQNIYIVAKFGTDWSIFADARV